MPKKAREMSAVEVKRIQEPGLHAVGGVPGLSMQVTPTGGRSWILRCRVAGKRRELGLGAYPSVSLAAARELARAETEKLKAGADPVAERRAQKAAAAEAVKRQVTFERALEEFLSSPRLDGLRNTKHRAQWGSTLREYALPVLGKIPVAEIRMTDVLKVLKPIWTEKPETAGRVRGRIERVLAWSTVQGYRDSGNPAVWRGGLSEALPPLSAVKRVVHHPALPVDSVADWMRALQQRKGSSARCLEFVALTAVRSGEARGARWDEIDLEAAIWTVPAERMKMKRAHRVPLSPQAVELLKGLPKEASAPELVFPAPRGGRSRRVQATGRPAEAEPKNRVLTDMAMSAVMRKMHQAEVDAGSTGWLDPVSGRPAVPHGLRSTFRDWAATRTDAPREVAEMCLAHIVASSTEVAYQRSDLLDQRRDLMDRWGAFLAG